MSEYTCTGYKPRFDDVPNSICVCGLAANYHRATPPVETPPPDPNKEREPKRYYVSALIPLEEGEMVSRCNEQVVLARDYDALLLQLQEARRERDEALQAYGEGMSKFQAGINAFERELAKTEAKLVAAEKRVGELVELVKLAATYLEGHDAWGWDTEILDKLAAILGKGE